MFKLSPDLPGKLENATRGCEDQRVRPWPRGLPYRYFGRTPVWGDIIGASGIEVRQAVGLIGFQIGAFRPLVPRVNEDEAVATAKLIFILTCP